MEKVFINGEELLITNPDQILNMGGPWICDISIPGKFTLSKVILNNFLIDTYFHRFYFIQYNSVSKWAANNYFTINFYDIETNLIYEFQKSFEMVFLNKLLNPNEMEIHNAFHNGFDKNKMSFYIQHEPYTLLQ